jgi:hypothetical protein
LTICNLYITLCQVERTNNILVGGDIMHREQRRSLLGIAVFGGVLIAASILFIFKSPAAIQENRVVELIYVLLIVGAAVGYGFILMLTNRKEQDAEISTDERDVEIARRALSAQLGSVLAAITLWCVVLSLIYMDGHLVPLSLIYIMVNSIFLINMLAKSISIYRGYLTPLPH